MIFPFTKLAVIPSYLYQSMTVMEKVSNLLWLLKINVCEFYLTKLQMILNNKWNFDMNYCFRFGAVLVDYYYDVI